MRLRDNISGKYYSSDKSFCVLFANLYVLQHFSNNVLTRWLWEKSLPRCFYWAFLQCESSENNFYVRWGCDEFLCKNQRVVGILHYKKSWIHLHNRLFKCDITISPAMRMVCWIRPIFCRFNKTHRCKAWYDQGCSSNMFSNNSKMYVYFCLFFSGTVVRLSFCIDLSHPFLQEAITYGHSATKYCPAKLSSFYSHLPTFHCISRVTYRYYLTATKFWEYHYGLMEQKSISHC